MKELLRGDSDDELSHHTSIRCLCCGVFWWIYAIDGSRYRQHEAVQREEEEQEKWEAEVNTKHKHSKCIHAQKDRVNERPSVLGPVFVSSLPRFAISLFKHGNVVTGIV
eukprot:COSAG02_NODE_8652_length_2489_cov_3.862343_5_plen_109_part_01